MIRVLAGASVFVGFCALPASLPVALPMIIIGGLIMFIGDTEKEDKEEQELQKAIEELDNPNLSDDIEKKGLYSKNPKKFNYTKNKNNG
ncbi:hypothetical protein N8841_02090 [Candidatus Pelagibacter sp.]|jgi:hypothetical protein|nr:hypothetical protein [Candidatus Pelagibacter sp.]|tara:strand:+ start:89 stop:355 length:267 start_codon:yes stop_codon:yes gene_type:complete